jgi:hypothetical protein
MVCACNMTPITVTPAAGINLDVHAAGQLPYTDHDGYYFIETGAYFCRIKVKKIVREGEHEEIGTHLLRRN